MKAYHFLRENMTAGSGFEPAWTVGETRVIEGEIIPCQWGYHSSPSLWQALPYAPGPVACLVDIPRKGTKRESDKSASPSRTLVKAVNIEKELRLFAADCAEHVLWIYERDYPNDDRPRKAIAATRAYVAGEIGAAAWAAAWDAARAGARAAAGAGARDAARAAAGAAAWDAAGAGAGAAAWDAARAGARAAAGDAAQAAAWVAVQAAARVAAWVAAGDAAGDAEREWQRKQFEQRFGGIFK